MANTRPFTEAHAVAWVDIAVLFDGKLSPTQQGELRASFDAALAPDGFVAGDAADRDGDAFHRKDIEGEVIEELHIHGRFVHVMWHEYRGWTFTREAALKRLAPVLQWLRDGRIKGYGIGMAYRDVFLNETPADYEPQDVFRTDSRYLPPVTFESGETWKQSSSWISWRSDRHPAGTYSVLSIEAAVQSSESDSEDEGEDEVIHVTEITHRQSNPWNQMPEGAVEWSDEELGSRLDLLHQQNKELLIQLLSDSMAGTIGLKE